MVDFPNSPTNGQQHTEEGETWKYVDPPGCWVVVSVTTFPDAPNDGAPYVRQSQGWSDADVVFVDKADVEVGGTTSRGQKIWVGTSAELAAITTGPGRDAQTLYFVLE